MNVSFLSPAQIEFKEAVDFYNTQSEGLGFEFANEVRNTVQRIVEYPQAWPHISKRTRRCRCIRFPYGVIYQIRREEILVIAIMNLHRKPDYWQNRL
jgi:hypothetical protein